MVLYDAFEQCYINRRNLYEIWERKCWSIYVTAHSKGSKEAVREYCHFILRNESLIRQGWRK